MALETPPEELRDLETPADVPSSARGSLALRRILVVLDALALAASWAVVLGAAPPPTGRSLLGTSSLVLAAALATAISLCVVASQKLYRARVCSVKAVEMVRLWRVAALSGLVCLAVARSFGYDLPLALAAAQGAIAFVLLLTFRDLYRAGVTAQRRRGRYCRSVLIVGTDAEGLALFRLLQHHPELGFRVHGVVGNADPSLEDAGAPWLGPVSDTLLAIRRVRATGVLISSTALPAAELSPLVRSLLRAKVHVQMSTGLRGSGSQQMSMTSLAYESLFYIEPVALSGWQTRLKRALDITLSLVLLVLTAPVVGLAAAAIRLEDGGPALFRQVRVGRDGRRFVMNKLRTMVPNAHERLADLRDVNERTGPLFKMAFDPRETRVGHFLRATSVDELPQLWNVLRGEMSLVGPRPALPEEVEEFAEELASRQTVPPGITGLWQVEARDKAQFEAYHRFDLYYVENWSMLLDLAIIFSTLQAVLATALSSLAHRAVNRSGATVPPAPPLPVLIPVAAEQAQHVASSLPAFD